MPLLRIDCPDYILTLLSCMHACVAPVFAVTSTPVSHAYSSEMLGDFPERYLPWKPVGKVSVDPALHLPETRNVHKIVRYYRSTH